MKKMKKLLSMLLAVVMVLAIAAPSFAADITINGKDNQSLVGKEFDIYQLFSATTAGDEGDNTKIAYTVAPQFKTDLIDILSIDTTGKTDEEVNAAIVNKIGEENFNVREFADTIYTKLTGKTVSQHVTVPEGNSKSYTITDLEPGYYIIVEKNATGDGTATSLCILDSAGASQEITIKSDVPTIDKHIEGTAGSKLLGTSVNVGDTVPFVLESKVPEMNGYSSYKYIIHDTLSSGLTFTDGSVTATINGKEVAVTVNHASGNLTITFPDFIKATDNEFGTDFNKTEDLVEGKDIVVTYTAKLNSGALSTDVENNKVYLEYSSNPYNENKTNKTPDKETYVYNFDIEIDKFVGNNAETKLSDAKFVLYKDGANNTKEYYFQDPATKEVSWEPLTDDQLSAELKKETDRRITEVSTDDKGKASFEGLAAGNYHLLETVAPNGYNKLEKPVDITITAEYNDNGTLKVDEFDNDGEKTTEGFETDNTKLDDGITVKHTTNTEGENTGYSLIAGIANNAGSLLPSTGGIGTTIFYAAGIILMAGAVFFVVRRKRA